MLISTHATDGTLKTNVHISMELHEFPVLQNRSSVARKREMWKKDRSLTSPDHKTASVVGRRRGKAGWGCEGEAGVEEERSHTLRTCKYFGI